MRRAASFDDVSSMLHSRASLIADGWSARAITAALDAESLHRVRRGWFMRREDWASLWPEGRHLGHVIAVGRDARGDRPVFAGPSAAVLHGLPLYRVSPRRVHVVVGDRERRSAPDVFRHEGSVPGSDVTERHGHRCTTLERTVRDLARSVPHRAAVAAADAALLRVSGGPRSYDGDFAREWKREQVALLPRGGRGVVAARESIAFADGRAESSGESVSRIHLVALGFQRIELQVPVAIPGGMAWIDIGLPDEKAFGEFDGKTKYLDEQIRSRRSIEEIVLREKQREDLVRGVTQWRLARWEDEHIDTAAALARRLASFGIRAPGR